LLEQAKNNNDMRRALTQAQAGERPGIQKMRSCIAPLLTDVWFQLQPELFIEWIPRVARFSFEAGKVASSVVTDK
jgi:hypothetical protein